MMLPEEGLTFIARVLAAPDAECRTNPDAGRRRTGRRTAIFRKKCGLTDHQSIHFIHISMTLPQRCLKFLDVGSNIATVNQLVART
jgi:hypothetical protein